jgi:hypothetical protein
MREKNAEGYSIRDSKLVEKLSGTWYDTERYDIGFRRTANAECDCNDKEVVI